MIVNACSPLTWETGAEGLLQVCDQTELCSEFEAS